MKCFKIFERTEGSKDDQGQLSKNRKQEGGDKITGTQK